MKYSIIYVQSNIFTDEKISVGLVCLTDSGCEYRYSPYKIEVSGRLLQERERDYVNYFVTGFDKNYLKGRSNAKILSSLDNLHRYSNNYVIFSPVRELNIPESIMTPGRLYSELIGDYDTPCTAL